METQEKFLKNFLEKCLGKLLLKFLEKFVDKIMGKFLEKFFNKTLKGFFESNPGTICQSVSEGIPVETAGEKLS